MPGVVENHRKWSEHDWQHGGHRWSPGGTSAGTDMMWWRSIRPRIHRFLPTGTLLEIAPGYGRWTAYLLAECRRLIGVDIAERCVDQCRKRFAGRFEAEFQVNDGESLSMIPDASVDFAFSLDSLVHVEAPQLQRYLQELARTLRRGGVAFLHHSNLGAYRAPRTGAVPAYVGERHWRADTMSARVFRDACRHVGLQCVSQEVINWIGRDEEVDRHRLPSPHIALTDCFSICRRALGQSPEATRVYFNRRFVDEWRQLIDLASLYAPAAGIHESVPDPLVSSIRRAMARGRSRLAGRRFARREPLIRALRASRCPDCGCAVASRGSTQVCLACDTTFMLC